MRAIVLNEPARPHAVTDFPVPKRYEGNRTTDLPSIRRSDRIWKAARGLAKPLVASCQLVVQCLPLELQLILGTLQPVGK